MLRLARHAAGLLAHLRRERRHVLDVDRLRGRVPDVDSICGEEHALSGGDVRGSLRGNRRAGVVGGRRPGLFRTVLDVQAFFEPNSKGVSRLELLLDY